MDKNSFLTPFTLSVGGLENTEHCALFNICFYVNVSW